MRPRKCGSATAQTAAIQAVLQWGRGLAAAEICRPGGGTAIGSPSFNGAAALRPRKFQRWSVATRDDNGASMGPRPCGRGNAVAALVAHKVAAQLQWGRGLAAAEMITDLVRRRSRTGASMGPRPCGRGNRTCWPCCANGMRRLQWGRGLAAAEIRVRHIYGKDGTAQASMGPRPCGRGNCSHPAISRAVRGASIGAVALRPWKLVAPQGLSSALRCFNGAAALRPRKSATWAVS